MSGSSEAKPLLGQSLEWFDTHAHLNYEYPVTREEYVRLAGENGVRTIITVAADPEDFPSLEEIAGQFENVYFTIGVHPHESAKLSPEIESQMAALSKHPKCLAVGEMGLDYHYKHATPAAQAHAFQTQIDLALEWEKPLIIHTRDAEQETLVFLRNYVERTALKDRPGVIHCFSGSASFAQECLDLGFFLSFSGIVTFKKAEDLRAVAAQTPLDRILLETDAPYLAPVPYRGKPNMSAYLPETARVIAVQKNIPLEVLAKHSVRNARKLFGLLPPLLA